MQFGVLGTGMVGQAIANKLIDLGHQVMIGAREAGNEKARAWAAAAGASASQGAFADAARFGERSLDTRQGPPPTLAVCNTDSLGEQIQRAFPDARVVKTLNTMNAEVMVNPGLVPSPHTVFVSGDNAGAKARVAELLRSFGWPAADILDLGGIVAARGTEMYLPLWLSLWGALGAGHFNIAVRSGETTPEDGAAPPMGPRPTPSGG